MHDLLKLENSEVLNGFIVLFLIVVGMFGKKFPLATLVTNEKMLQHKIDISETIREAFKDQNELLEDKFTRVHDRIDNIKDSD